jgi:hypothetical protein
MTSSEERRRAHIAEHNRMHGSFDRLMGDYMMHHPGRLLSNTTLWELGEWSARQTVMPDERDDDGMGDATSQDGELPRVKLTEGEVRRGSCTMVFELTFPVEPGPERDGALSTIGKLLGVVLRTPKERETFLAELQQAHEAGRVKTLARKDLQGLEGKAGS